MPRRRRVRLGAPKIKKKPEKWSGGDPDAPTEKEWNLMETFNIVLVPDDEQVEHSFTIGDNVLVMPPTPVEELNDFWVANIRDIRCKSAKTPDVWVRVQWYYSPKDVASVVKSFDANACGNLERILSDHFDLVHSTTLDGIAPIQRYVEEDVEQKDIGEEEFYCRYDFEREARNVTPKPGTYTCICGEPYNPDDESTVMHFCPRPKCQKAYHRNCLVKGKHVDPVSSSRPTRLLLSSPDTDEDYSVPNRSVRQATTRKSRRQQKDVEQAPLSDMLSELPEKLVAAAQQPIIKGAKFKAGGVVGNVNAVIQARRMVYKALEGKGVPDDWENLIDMEKATAGLGARKAPALVCPECQGAI